MKKILFFLSWIIYIPAVVFAQNTGEINYKQIEKYIKKHLIDFETLLNRYETNDSLLTNQDYASAYVYK